MTTRKPVDRELYRGYEILLWSHDWDAMFEVRLNGFKVGAEPDRAAARALVIQLLASR